MIREDLFFDCNHHLLEDEKPSLFLNEFISLPQAKKDEAFKLLVNLKETPQNPKYHPEGNVWNHTILVVDNAAQYKRFSQDKVVFMWTALLHDIGKPPTTKYRHGKLTSYDHDIIGMKLANKFLTSFNMNSDFIDSVCKMVRWHMQPLFVMKKNPLMNLKQMLSDVSASEIGLFSLCDRLGRGKLTQDKIKEEHAHIIDFLEKCYQKENVPIKKRHIYEMMKTLSEVFSVTM